MEPATPPSVHRVTREEIFIALDGKAVLRIGAVERELAEGGAAIVPAKTDFALFNPHPAPFEALAILPVGAKAVVGDGPSFTPECAA